MNVDEIRVAEIKNSAKRLQVQLVKLFKHSDDLINSDRKAIKNFINKLQDIRQRENIENIDSYEKEFEKIETEVSKKWNVYIPVELPEYADKLYSAEQEVVYVSRPAEKTEEKRKSDSFIAALMASLLTLTGCGLLAAGCNYYKDRFDGNNTEETIERSETNLETPAASMDNEANKDATATATPGVLPLIVTEEPLVTEEPTESEEVTAAVEAVLGEYGTFLDVTNDAQVEARADYILDNYYKPIIDNLSKNERSIITKENIANVIRVLNGICPIDENGYRVIDANTALTYGQLFTELVSNIPSSDSLQESTGKLSIVPAYLFAEDGSELQEFIESYDEIYARVANGRNINSSKVYRTAGKIMAAKYLTEWKYMGMYSNILYNKDDDTIDYATKVIFDENIGKYVATVFEYNESTDQTEECEIILNNYEVYPVHNPYNIDGTHRLFAYQATMTRYASFIKEAEFNQMATICIPSCTDYSSKLREEKSIAEIYTAIDSGVENDIIAKSAGMKEPTEPVVVSFLRDLQAQLEFDYRNTQRLTND